MLGLVIGAALLPGCGDKPPAKEGAAADPIEARSGTRIKARFYQAEPGVQTFREFFDSKLGVACTFVLAADQQLRCLPLQFRTSSSEFADPACSTPIVFVPRPACDKPAYVFRWETTADHCSSRGRVYQLGEPIDRTFTNSSFLTDGAACSKISYNLLPGDQANLLGAEVPLDSFVRGQRVPAGSSSGALSPMVIEAEDGARGPSGWDVGLGTSCNVVLVDGGYRCIPEPTDTPSFTTYADASCSTAVFVNWAGCPPPRYGLRYDICSVRPQILAVGEPTTNLFSQTRGVCGTQAPSPAGDYRPAGAVIPATSFVALTESTGEAGVRVKRRYLAGPGSTKVGSGLFNVARNEPCRIGTSDGTQWRCGPGGVASSGSAYADPACTQPVWAVRSSDSCTTGPSVYLYDDLLSCPARKTYYKKGDPWTGEVFGVSTSYDSNGNKSRRCAPARPDAGTTYFALTPFPDSDFVPLELVER